MVVLLPTRLSPDMPVDLSFTVASCVLLTFGFLAYPTQSSRLCAFLNHLPQLSPFLPDSVFRLWSWNEHLFCSASKVFGSTSTERQPNSPSIHHILSTYLRNHIETEEMHRLISTVYKLTRAISDGLCVFLGSIAALVNFAEPNRPTPIVPNTLFGFVVWGGAHVWHTKLTTDRL